MKHNLISLLKAIYRVKYIKLILFDLKVGVNMKQMKFKDFLLFSFRVSKIYGLATLLNLIFSGFYPLINIYAMSNLIKTIIEFQSTRNLKIAIYSIVLYLFILGINHVSQSVYKYITISQTIKIQNSLNLIFIDKVLDLKYDYIENSKYYDEISLLQNNFFDKYLSYHREILYSIKVLLNMASILIVVIGIAKLKGIMIIIGCIPMAWIINYNGKKSYEENEKLIREDRYSDYLNDVLIGKQFAYERAMYRYEDKISERWKRISDNNLKLRLQTNLKNTFRLELTSIILGFLFFYVILDMVKISAIGKIHVSVLLPTVNQIIEFLNILRWELNQSIESLVNSKNYLRRLNDFLSFPDEGSDNTNKDEKIESIEFKNVYFTYPSREKSVLKGVSFTIESGKKYEIVGENGSGKSTILKLLLSLYDNYQGEILVNGKELREYKTNPFSVVFQDYAKFYLSLEDNIRIGNLSASKETLEVIMKKFNLHNIVAKGILRNSDEEGSNLSIGQWQRVAIARCFINNKNAFILDEPNASLDIHQETNLYNAFKEIEDHKISIIISHRLGLSKLVDEIIVLNDGKIEAVGSHHELMKSKEGLYYKMYENQRGLYA